MKNNKAMYQVCVIQINSHKNRQVNIFIGEGEKYGHPQHIHYSPSSEITDYLIALFKYTTKFSIPLDKLGFSLSFSHPSGETIINPTIYKSYAGHRSLFLHFSVEVFVIETIFAQFSSASSGGFVLHAKPNLQKSFCNQETYCYRSIFSIRLHVSETSSPLPPINFLLCT